MSCQGNSSDINQTFIIEPLSITGGSPTLSACTSLFSNAIVSCSGDTQIFMGTGIITFDGSIYTNQDLTASTINASTYFSGGTNLIDIINLTQITGGTFNNVTDTLTLEQTNGVQINVTGFTDYYTTGATLIGSTIYFDRTDLLSAYTVNLSSLNVDTYVTGVTFNDNQLIITRNDGVSVNTFINSFTGLTINGSLSATTYYGDGSNLTGIPNTFTTGATYSNGFVYFDRNDILSAYTLNLSVLTGDTNTFVTGGTVSGNTLELFRNDGVQIDIDLSEINFSGGSGNCITNLYVTNVHGCSPITFHDTLRILNGLTVTGSSIFDGVSATTISATTYLNLPIDVFVTGGTYSNGTTVFTNSTGGTFSVSGFSTGSNFTGGTVSGATQFTGGLTADTMSATTYLGLPMDVYSTGLTINNATYDLQITRNDGVILTANLGTLASDVNITGGTYNNNTGVVTFVNNTGGTFNVSGFTTGITDTTITSFSYDNANKFTITDSTGGTFNAIINTVTGLTVNGSFSATTYLGLPLSISADTYWTSGSTGTNSIKAKNNTGLDATGNYAVAEGLLTLASGIGAHAEGTGTTASGSYSHAEGNSTVASGTSAHAEGVGSVAGGVGSHAEGGNSLDLSRGGSALANGSHAEGVKTTALGLYSHAEGFSTITSGSYSHSEGQSTIASGQAGSHAEGRNTTASGVTSHAEGLNTLALGGQSHSEGQNTVASGDTSHAEGYQTYASGDYSHSEGYFTTATGIASHAEGSGTTSSGQYSHAGGRATIASGNTSFVHGDLSIAGGDYSIVLGANITGTTANTTYVDHLNIKTVPTGTTVGNLGIDASGNVILGTTGTSITFSGTPNYYARFNSGSTIENGIIYDNGAASVFVAPATDNASLAIVSPSGFYYPSLSFFNNGGTPLGGISAYANSLYLSGAGAIVTPLIVSGVVQFPYLSANTLTYLDTNSVLRNVTLGTGLSLTSGGTLNASATGGTQNLFQVLTEGNSTGDLPIISSDGFNSLIVDNFTVGMFTSTSGTNQSNQVYVLNGQGAGFFVTDDLNTIASRFDIYSSQQTISDGSTTNTMVIDDTLSNKGLVYIQDYSANFTPESLVSKRYVDSITGITSLQQAYNNSTTPEIVTDATLGALSIKNGSGILNAIIFEGLNTGGTITSTITGLGDISGNTLSVSAITANTYTVNQINGLSATTAQTINLALSDQFSYTLTGNTTFTFSNNANGKSWMVGVKQNPSTSGYTASFTATTSSVKWQNGVTPIMSPTTGATDVFAFTQINSTIYGSYVQNF